MKRFITQFQIGIAMVFLAIGVASCQDGDKDDSPSGRFEVTIENVGQSYSIQKSDAFTTPVGASEAGPLFPGDAYEFEFTAPKGAHLSLATMFVQSNDWIYATDEEGIALYNDDGTKVTGDVTAMIDLYDAGTEEDQKPGVGDNQAPRQNGPDTGPADDDSNVRLVDDSGLPANNEVIKVTLSSTSTYGFKVRIENVSDGSTLQTSEGGKAVPLSPGVWLVHASNQSGLLYTVGQADYSDGLEAIAEDGDPGTLIDNLADETGLTVPLAPGAFAVYKGDNPIFMDGEAAPENGIEAVAEDGQPGMLAAYLADEEMVSESDLFNQPVGASGPGPLLPGGQYKFAFSAQEGDRLSFATMYVESNDLFYGPMTGGIDLFEGGSPVTGDITDQMVLWDAGTEINEEPGVGGYQALRQPSADSGPDDSNSNMRAVNDGYDYGDISSRINVTIQQVQN